MIKIQVELNSSAAKPNIRYDIFRTQKLLGLFYSLKYMFIFNSS